MIDLENQIIDLIEARIQQAIDSMHISIDELNDIHIIHTNSLNGQSINKHVVNPNQCISIHEFRSILDSILSQLNINLDENNKPNISIDIDKTYEAYLKNLQDGV